MKENGRIREKNKKLKKFDFFCFFDVTEKLAIVFGLFTFGIIEQLSHNIRFSALFLTVFFIIGFILLFRVLKFNSLLIQKEQQHD